jgi:hypothetical protein
MEAVEQQTDETPVNKALVFLGGGAGPIVFYAVFWGRHPDVASAHVDAHGMAMLAVSGLGVLVLAGLAGLLALIACRRLFEAFTLGVTAVACIFVVDLGAAPAAAPPAAGQPVAAARAGLGQGPLALAQSNQSLIRYFGLILSPVSTVAQYHERRGQPVAPPPPVDDSDRQELEDQLADAREELRRETERLQQEVDDAVARFEQADEARSALQARIREMAEAPADREDDAGEVWGEEPAEDATADATDDAEDDAAADEAHEAAMREAQELNDELTRQLMAATTTREGLERDLEAARAAAADAEEVREELARVREELQTVRTNDAATITSLRARLTEAEGRIEMMSGPVEIAMASIIAMGSRVSGVLGNQPGEVKLVRMEAERAFRGIGEPGIDALLEAMRAENPLIREFAIDQLGRQGSAAERALKELNSISTKDPDSGVRTAAKRAISRIVGE